MRHRESILAAFSVTFLAFMIFMGVTAKADSHNVDYMAPRGIAILPQPVRVADTRESGTPNHIVLLDRPYWADVALVNLTITNTQADGYAVAYDCKSLPDTSNINWQRGETVANMAFSMIGPGDTESSGVPGDLCVFLSSPADVVVDLVGWSMTAGYYRVP